MDLKLLLVFGIAVIAVTANRYEYLDMDDDADDEKDEEIDNDVSEEIENDELPANEKEGINMIGENIICRCYPIKGAKNAKKHKAKGK